MKRRESAEQQAGAIANTASELEAQLAQNKQAQSELRQELEKAQKQLQDQQQIQALSRASSNYDPGIQTAKSDVEQQVQKLTESWLKKASIAKRRTSAGDIEKRPQRVGAQLAQLAARLKPRRSNCRRNSRIRGLNKASLRRGSRNCSRLKPL